MKKRSKDYRDLSYLTNRPKYVYWKVVAEAPGKSLSCYERYDIILDEHDLKIRGMNGLS